MDGSRTGSTAPGDGWKYRGRGLVQLTGKSNYQRCGDALGLGLVGSPELLEQPANAALAGGWFWSVNGLNTLTDAGNFTQITQRVNGAADRLAIDQRAL